MFKLFAMIVIGVLYDLFCGVKNFFLKIWSWIVGHFNQNMSYIDDGIYQGSAISDCPVFIQAVISLQIEVMDDLHHVMAFCWMPIEDTTNQVLTVGWLDAAVNTIASWRAAGWNVLIHCLEGKSRSGAVDIAYHMKKNKSTFEDAYALVKQHRIITKPNDGFVRDLKTYEKWLKDETTH